MDPAQHPVLGIDSFSSAPTHITHQNKSCHLFTMGQWSDLIGPNALFNLYAEYIMRNTGLEEHKLESRLLGEISITSDVQMIPPLWQKVKKN